MILLMVERTIYYLSLYWYFAGATFFPYSSLWVPLVCIGIAAMSTWLYCKYTQVWFFVLPVLPCLMFAKNYSVFPCVISALLTMILIYTRKKSLSIDAFRSFFLTFSGIGIFTCIINGITHNVEAVTALYPLILSFLAGIMVNRGLQFPEAQKDRDFQKINMLTLGIWCMAGLILSDTCVLHGIGYLVKTVYAFTLYPCICLIMYILQIFLAAVVSIFQRLFHFDFTVEFPKLTVTDMNEYMFFNNVDTYTYSDYSSLKWVPCVVSLLVLFLILFIIYRKWKRAGRYTAVYTGDTSYVTVEKIPVYKPKGRENSFRKQYKKYIVFLRQQGMNHTSCSTTLEDYRQAVQLNEDKAEVAEFIKNLYRKGRYDTAYTIRKEDVKRLKKQVEAFKK